MESDSLAVVVASLLLFLPLPSILTTCPPSPEVARGVAVPVKIRCRSYFN